MQSLELLVFEAGGTRFATPLSDLARVVASAQAPPAGALDLGLLAGGQQASGEACLVVARWPDATVRIDRVNQVVRVSSGHLHQLPGYIREHCRLPFIWGLAELETEAIIVVDLPRLCADGLAAQQASGEGDRQPQRGP